MLDKKIEYNIKLPEAVKCPRPYCLGHLIPIFTRENNLSDVMVVIWKCSGCNKEIR